MSAIAIPRETVFDKDRIYRFTLWREWDKDLLTGCADDLPNVEKYIQFIGLNPSTADENIDDPTIRRCIDFSKRWGYGSFCMTNIFPFRATDPMAMKLHSEPDEMRITNAKWVERIAKEAGLIICAWGAHGKHHGRGEKFLRHFQKVMQIKVHHLGLNADGSPKHPLYLKSTTTPIPF